MGFSAINSGVWATSNTTSVSNTTPFITSTSDLFVLFVALYANGGTILAGDVTDTDGNTWHHVGNSSNSSDGNIQVHGWYAFSPVNNANNVITYNHGAVVTFPCMILQCWKGSDKTTAPTSSSGDNGAGSTSVQLGSTSSPAGYLNATAVCFSSAFSAPSIDTNFTFDVSHAWSSGVNEGGADAFHVATATGEQPTWSWTTSSKVSAFMMSFVPAATGSLFRTPPVSGVGIGGPFFRDPLQGKGYRPHASGLYVPERMAA